MQCSWREIPDGVGNKWSELVIVSRSATLPLRRFGTAEEAVAAVVFLMVVNGWMNGATLNVDGGSRLV